MKIKERSVGLGKTFFHVEKLQIIWNNNLTKSNIYSHNKICRYIWPVITWAAIFAILRRCSTFILSLTLTKFISPDVVSKWHHFEPSFHSCDALEARGTHLIVQFFKSNRRWVTWQHRELLFAHGIFLIWVTFTATNWN